MHVRNGRIFLLGQVGRGADKIRHYVAVSEQVIFFPDRIKKDPDARDIGLLAVCPGRTTYVYIKPERTRVIFNAGTVFIQ